ncbi:MAG: hypothetical protein B6I38_03095 [Anaerolineaceae bacterium 4572_5.1]|nr:MAG: hypothetical protein B6I38_03095 [Anaerolineaceae bacterium 4572_5.1]
MKRWGKTFEKTVERVFAFHGFVLIGANLLNPQKSMLYFTNVPQSNSINGTFSSIFSLQPAI